MTININESKNIWQKKGIPLFPTDELHSFVAKYLNRRLEFLDLTDQTPAPLYVLERSVLEERSRQFQQAFKKNLPDTGFYYAVKSNNHPDVAAILVKTGMGLDVSSGIELAMALETSAKNIVFSGPGKTDSELRLAIENADKVTVLTDSFGELARLKKLLHKSATILRIGVRLTTNPAGLWRKFGILPEQLAEFCNETLKDPNIAFQGLQFHTSWNLTPQANVNFIQYLGTTLNSLPTTILDKIRFIDIGGGFWPPQGEWLQPAGMKACNFNNAPGSIPSSPFDHYRLPACSIEEFADEISNAVRKHIHNLISCRICTEPGRWICNDAMHLLLSVVDKKGDDLVITDAGTNTVGWERFENDYFPVINLSKPALKERACSVLGSLCTPHDVWGYSYWGEEIREGDILMIPTQGAYTYSLRQNFIKPLPQVVII